MSEGRARERWIAAQRMAALLLWRRVPPSPAGAVEHLAAMQAQEYRLATWAVAQRCRTEVNRSDVDRAVDEGTVLRTHVLRPTWHFVLPRDLRWLAAMSGPRVIARNSRRYHELELDGTCLARSNDVIGEAVASGALTRQEVAQALEKEGLSVAGQRLAYMLMHAELCSVICSGPRRGPHHTYAAFDERVPDSNGPSGDDALAELARRYFKTRGPATIRDFSWWSGLAVADARRGLEAAKTSLASQTAGDRAYWFGHDDARPRPSAVDLVHCYDEVIVSYTESRDVLHPHGRRIAVPGRTPGFSHVILAGGQLVGRWRSVPAPDGVRVDVQLERAVGQRVRAALDRAIARYVRFALV